MSDVTNKGKFTLWFINNGENKIPSSQAKGGLTYDGISGKIHHSSMLSITDMLTKVKILIWIKKDRFRENDDRYYTKVHIMLQFKSGKMGSFKSRIKFFSDEIFTVKYF